MNRMFGCAMLIVLLMAVLASLGTPAPAQDAGSPDAETLLTCATGAARG